MTFDEHESGQLRLGASGDQLELLPLEDARIPLEAPPSSAEMELARRLSDHRAADMHAARWQAAEELDELAGIHYAGKE